ncbi:hypothetical protein Tco_0110607 [Tanacetum coccineum]
MLGAAEVKYQRKQFWTTCRPPRPISSHMLGAAESSIPENNFGRLQSAIEEDGTLENSGSKIDWGFVFVSSYRLRTLAC